MGKKNLAIVEWTDAISQDSWEVTTQRLNPVKIISCGIIIEETENHIQLALNYDSENDAISCSISIPSGMIKKITLIGEVEDGIFKLVKRTKKRAKTSKQRKKEI